MNDPQSRQARPIVDELREMRDIARREHGPEGRSTKRIEAALAAAQRESANGSAVDRFAGRRSERSMEPDREAPARR
jgi:hypothetical protein